VHTRPSGSTTLIGTLRRRGAAIPLGLLAAGALVISIVSSVAASAAPQPTIAQVQARLSQLNTTFEQLVQRYDMAQQELASARQRLILVDGQAARYLSRFKAMRTQVAQIAAAAYENGSLTSPAVLLTSGSAQQILDQASILTELASSNSNQMKQFVSAARQLAGAQQAARRTRDAQAALRSKLASEKRSVEKTMAQEKTLLAQLTPVQQAATGSGVPTGSTSPTGPVGGQSPLPTSTQAGKAVAFAYAQLGKPYVFGAAGPDSYDCSGLTQSAWAAAGVSIPRTSFDQWGSLPHVSMSAIQPGDILVFNGAGHVAIYVGNNMLIDALHPGTVVEKVPFAGWYQQVLDGAVRP
jgi:cell wall-associated NlpC family hydrolase